MAGADTSLPRWMQGPWADGAPLVRQSPACRPEPAIPAATAPLVTHHDVIRENAEPDAFAPQPILSGLAIVLLVAIGSLTVAAQSMPPAEDGLTVRLPEATPFNVASLLDEPRAQDSEVALNPEEVAAVRQAIEQELADPGYDRPEPPGRAYRAATSADRDRALTCMTQAIYYEAGTEPEAGQRAVAQVILNRVRHPSYPNSICGVVYQGSERSTGCQFTFTCDGALARRPAASLWTQSRRYAQDAIGGRAFGGVGYATHYHTLDVWPYWGRRLTMTNMIGRHLFHRLRGTPGGPGAFTSRYTGREPAPRPWRPRAPAVAASGGPAETPAEASTVARAEDRLPAAPRVVARPAQASVEPNNLPQSQVIENNLPDSQVRPEFRDSGRWIAD